MLDPVIILSVPSAEGKIMTHSRDNSPQRKPHPSDGGEPIALPKIIDEPIMLAEEVAAKPSIPSANEIAAYLERSQLLSSVRSVSITEIVAAARVACELRERLEGLGQWSSQGGIAALEVREEWAQQTCKTISALTKQAELLYIEPSKITLKTIAEDFVSRLSMRGVTLTGSFSSSAISAALEQTRLMVVFAGRALKSEEHAQTAISGIQERSFATESDGTKPAGDRSAGDRQTEFEKRQAAKAAASAAKRAALKAGTALPTASASQKPPLDDEKMELVASTAAQHRAQAESCRPTDQQRKMLRLRDLKELERAFGGRKTTEEGAAWSEEFEKIRVETVNIFANRIKDWFGLEAQLGAAAGEQRLTVEELPVAEASAVARHAKLARELLQLRTLQKLVLKDLTTIARAVLNGPERLKERFSAAELRTLREILDPPRPLQGYELAD